ELGDQVGGDALFLACVEVAEGGVKEDARKRAFADDEDVAVDVDACEQRGDLCFQGVGGSLVAERLVLSGLHGRRNISEQAAEIAGGALNRLLERLPDLVSALKDEVIGAPAGGLGGLRIADDGDRTAEPLV